MALSVPKRGIERVAQSLLIRADATTLTDVSPKYRRQVYYAEFEAAVSLTHDMGYGMTPAHVKSIVFEVYSSGGGFKELAAKLDTISAL